MWYIAAAAPGSELYVGLKRGTTRREFEDKLRTGAVAECFHRVAVRPGDAMFLPSGRVHAIGGGLVIFEIQQNSDTTYRVYDWNRVGLDGQPRDLHVTQSLASINFDDHEPALAGGGFACGMLRKRTLVNDPLFSVVAFASEARETVLLQPPRLRMVGVVEGRLTIASGADCVELGKGRFGLIPAAIAAELRVEPGSNFLLVEAGE
jgi:mannose-6-phosphate isomerase